MRKETKLLKNILKTKYPNETFSFQYKTAYQYVDSSDKIIIAIPQRLHKEIVELLAKNTKNIKIYLYKTFTSISGTSNPMIFDIVRKEWIDADLLEFIELKLF